MILTWYDHLMADAAIDYSESPAEPVMHPRWCSISCTCPRCRAADRVYLDMANYGFCQMDAVFEKEEAHA
jgi:hypothetical protein